MKANGCSDLKQGASYQSQPIVYTYSKPWKRPDVCTLSSEIGPCRAAVSRYFFNEESGKCEMFMYGGCSGNGNNFENLKDCENACYMEKEAY